jgi:hypothetical protein
MDLKKQTTGHSIMKMSPGPSVSLGTQSQGTQSQGTQSLHPPFQWSTKTILNSFITRRNHRYKVKQL